MSTPPAVHYKDLGPFSDLVLATRAMGPFCPAAPPGPKTRNKLRAALRFTIGDEQPRDIRVDRRWTADGVSGEEVSWSVGFGPRTGALVLRPSGTRATLPGVLALHDHGHHKLLGKEKIADGPDGPASGLGNFREIYYGGRAYANLLAREGFVVLAHDTFLWGSRRFPMEVMPERERALSEAVGATLEQETTGVDVMRYNGAALLHEHLVSKYCTLLGTSFAAIVAYEDRVALNYLRRRDDVDAALVGCVGLSGGGARSALLRATSDDLRVCAIAGMMSTYEGLLDDCVAPHTWMFFPPGLSAAGDWPDLASCAAPAPLLVQYLLDDAQFTEDGMRGADARIGASYAHVGARNAYVGEFYPGPHRFDVNMQEAAFAWLRRQLLS